MGEVVLTQTSRGLDFLVPGSATNQMLPSKTEPCSQNLKEVYDSENVSKGQHLLRHQVQRGFPGGEPLSPASRHPRTVGTHSGPDAPYLQLHGTALTAHSVATGTEGRVDLPLTAQHAEHGLLQLTQLLLEHSGLLAAEAFTATAVHAFRGLERRVWRARVASRNQVHDAGIVQGPPGMVIDLL